MNAYRDFFIASTGASAAYIGLLFVALSFIDSEKIDEKTQTWRRIIANSSFSQLVNIFFVSLAGLLPDPHNVALVGLVMAALGIAVSFRLLPPTLRQNISGRNTPTILGIITVIAYSLELVMSVKLLNYPYNQTMAGYFILSIIILYAGALARAWEITGIRRG